MKKLSDRTLRTIVLVVVLITATITVIILNNINEVQSKKWQQEQGIQIEEKLNGK